MTTPISQEMDDAIRGNDIGDYIDQIWANAARAAPRSRPSDQAASRPDAPRFDRLSQEDDQ